MRLIDYFPLIFGGVAFALSMGMFFVGRDAIRRIRGLGREDPQTLWRLGAIRFFTATIVLAGLFISASLLLLQVDVSIGLFGPADDTIGLAVLLAWNVWCINVILLGVVIDPKRDRSP